MSIEKSINTSLNKILLELSLGKHQTLLFNIACLIKFNFTEDIKVAGIDSKECLINPTFFSNLPDPSKRFLIKHELWHIASGHMLRRGHRDSKLWNIACDIVINNRLVREGMSYVGLENMYCDESLDESISEEEVYELYSSPEAEVPESVLEDLIGDVSSEESFQAEKDMQGKILTAVLKLNPSLVDMLPDVLKEMLTEDKQTKVDWKSEVAMFVRNSSLYDERYSYRKPSRTGYYDIAYPRLKESDPVPDSFNIYIDVSGSINEDLLNQFACEISTISETYPDVKITIHTFNTRIQDSFEFEHWSINRFRVGGGTDVNCVMKHIEFYPNLNYIVFSDMYTEHVKWENYSSSHNILWVIIDNDMYEPRIGKGVHINV